MKLPLSVAPAALGVWAYFALSASAEPIRHPTAIFAGLDKTTGRIINFDVAIDETVQFGALQVTPRVCNTRPQTETPQTTSFVEVDELILKSERGTDPKAETARVDSKQEAKRIFSGWMFAASPGLHGVEHPVYDVWLVDCKGGKEAAPPPAEAAAPATPPVEAEAAPPADSGKKRRSRRVEPAAPPPMENQPIGPADQAAPPPIDPEAAPPPSDVEAAPPAEGRRKKRRRGQQSAPAAQPAPEGNPLFPF